MKGIAKEQLKIDEIGKMSEQIVRFKKYCCNCFIFVCYYEKIALKLIY